MPQIHDTDNESGESQEAITLMWAQSGNSRIREVIVFLFLTEETTVSGYSLYVNLIYQHCATGQ